MKYKKILAILTSATVLVCATAFANAEEADIATPDVVVSEETDSTEETDSGEEIVVSDIEDSSEDVATTDVEEVAYVDLSLSFNGISTDYDMYVIEDGTPLHLQSDSDSEVIDTISYGTKVHVIAIDYFNPWYQVEVNGETGYICSSYLFDYNPATNEIPSECAPVDEVAFEAMFIN